MIIKNNTNGKSIEVTKEQWDSFGKRVKAGYTILNPDDAPASNQIVAKKLEVVETSTRGGKTNRKPPASGTKSAEL